MATVFVVANRTRPATTAEKPPMLNPVVCSPNPDAQDMEVTFRMRFPRITLLNVLGSNVQR